MLHTGHGGHEIPLSHRPWRLSFRKEVRAMPRQIFQFVTGFRGEPAAQIFWSLVAPLLIVMKLGTGQLVPPIEVLLAMPEGTLGRALAAFLQERKLRVIMVGPRRMQLHDALHVITGYDSTVLGEQELQGWLIGAGPRLINFFVSAYYVTRGFDRPRFAAAFRRGRRCTLDPNSWRAEDEWHLPLEELRRKYAL
jgi:hypothetical protein